MPLVNSRPVMAAPRPVSARAKTTTSQRRSNNLLMLRLEPRRWRRCLGSLRDGTDEVIRNQA